MDILLRRVLILPIRLASVNAVIAKKAILRFLEKRGQIVMQALAERLHHNLT